MTIRKRFFCFLAHAVACALICGLSASAFAQTAHLAVEASPKPETVTDSTPYQLLLAITAKLQEAYEVPITYEDTRHVNDTEIDNTRPLTFKREGRSITYTFTPPPSAADFATRKKMAGEVVADVVQKYNTLRGAEMFRVTETDDGLHVVATKFLNTSGQMEDFQPIFDMPITIAQGERTGQEILDEIAHQIDMARGGNPAGFAFWWPHGTQGPSIVRQKKIELTATDEPVRSILERLFQQLPVTALKKRPGTKNMWDKVAAHWSWQLVTSPNGGLEGESHAWLVVVKPPATE